MSLTRAHFDTLWKTIVRSVEGVAGVALHQYHRYMSRCEVASSRRTSCLRLENPSPTLVSAFEQSLDEDYRFCSCTRGRDWRIFSATGRGGQTGRSQQLAIPHHSPLLRPPLRPFLGRTIGAYLLPFHLVGDSVA